MLEVTFSKDCFRWKGPTSICCSFVAFRYNNGLTRLWRKKWKKDGNNVLPLPVKGSQSLLSPLISKKAWSITKSARLRTHFLIKVAHGLVNISGKWFIVLFCQLASVADIYTASREITLGSYQQSGPATITFSLVTFSLRQQQTQERKLSDVQPDWGFLPSLLVLVEVQATSWVETSLLPGVNRERLQAMHVKNGPRGLGLWVI